MKIAILGTRGIPARSFGIAAALLLQPRTQFRKPHAKPFRNLHQIREAQIRFVPFDRAHERAVHSTMIGETLLRVTRSSPEAPISLWRQRFQHFHSQENERLTFGVS
jgi:hypothetical protein